MKKILLVLNIIICISSIIYVIYFFREQSFHEIAAELGKVKGNYLFILSISFCANAIGTTALVVSFNYKIPLRKFYLFHAIDSAGNAVSKVTPTNIVVGDSYKALTFFKFGIGRTVSTSALIIYRFFCLLSNFTFFFICVILYLFLENRTYPVNFSTVIAILSGIVVLTAAAILLTKKNRYVSRLFGKIKTHIDRKPKLENIYKTVRDVFLTMRMTFHEHTSKFFLLVLLTTLQKFGGVLELFFLLKSLDIPTTLYSCMIFEMGIIIMRVVFAAIPMQLGVEEVWNKVLLDFIHISTPQTWLTVSIIRRFRMLTWIVYGFFFLIVLNIAKSRNPGHHSR